MRGKRSKSKFTIDLRSGQEEEEKRARQEEEEEEEEEEKARGGEREACE